MQITITCNSMKELKEAVDQLFVLFPEQEKKASGTAQRVNEAIEQDKRERRRGRGLAVNREQILALRQKGHTPKEIAEKTGYGYSTVCRVIQESSE